MHTKTTQSCLKRAGDDPGNSDHLSKQLLVVHYPKLCGKRAILIMKWPLEKKIITIDFSIKKLVKEVSVEYYRFNRHEQIMNIKLKL